MPREQLCADSVGAGMTDELTTVAQRFCTDRKRGSCEADDCDAHHCPRCQVHTMGRCGSCDMCDVHDEHDEPVPKPLDWIARDRLFESVRERWSDIDPLARSASDVSTLSIVACDGLGLDLESARALTRAAGCWS